MVVDLNFGIERPITVNELVLVKSLLVPLHEYIREHAEADQSYNRRYSQQQA